MDQQKMQPLGKIVEARIRQVYSQAIEPTQTQSPPILTFRVLLDYEIGKWQLEGLVKDHEATKLRAMITDLFFILQSKG